MNDSGVRVAITGGAGFLGDALARRLLDVGVIELDGSKHSIAELILLDVRRPSDELATCAGVSVITGNLADTLGSLGDVDAVFHLAGVVSGAAEANFDLGMETNLYALIALLDHARAMSNPPMVVFTSSLAVFGQDPYGPPLAAVDDDTLPRPQSSYGVQKYIGEQLVADYARRGFLRGRSVRLMTVAVRPGAPNAAASSFLSGIIREPLAGVRSVCPVPADMPVAVSSPTRTVEGIVRAAAVTSDQWGSLTAMNLPALTTTPRAMVAALDRVAPVRSELIDWTADTAIVDIVATWPARFVTRRAGALGLQAAESFDEIVEEYMSAHAPV